MASVIEIASTPVLTEEWEAVVEHVIDDRVCVAAVVDGELVRHVYNKKQFLNPEAISPRMTLTLRVQYLVSNSPAPAEKLC